MKKLYLLKDADVLLKGVFSTETAAIEYIGGEGFRNEITTAHLVDYGKEVYYVVDENGVVWLGTTKSELIRTLDREIEMMGSNEMRSDFGRQNAIQHFLSLKAKIASIPVHDDDSIYNNIIEDTVCWIHREGDIIRVYENRGMAADDFVSGAALISRPFRRINKVKKTIDELGGETLDGEIIIPV